MHSAAGYGSWFSPTMCSAGCTWVGSRSDQDSYRKRIVPEFVCKWTETTSSRRSQSGCFDLHPIAVFTPDQTDCTDEESAPESVLTGPHSSGVKTPLDSTELNKVGVKHCQIYLVNPFRGPCVGNICRDHLY